MRSEKEKTPEKDPKNIGKLVEKFSGEIHNVARVKHETSLTATTLKKETRNFYILWI